MDLEPNPRTQPLAALLANSLPLVLAGGNTILAQPILIMQVVDDYRVYGYLYSTS